MAVTYCRFLFSTSKEKVLMILRKNSRINFLKRFSIAFLLSAASLQAHVSASENSSEDTVQVPDLPDDMIHEILLKTNYREWDKLRTVNRRFNKVLAAQSVRLSMNLDKVQETFKKNIVAPQ